MSEAKVAISIIMPAYNAAPWIVDALDSVLRQEIAHNWEFIVINDASTDDTAEIIRHWQDVQVFDNCTFILVDLIKNNGVSFARNIGIEKAKGHWLMFMDSDDSLLNKALGKVLKSIELSNKTDLLFTPITVTETINIEDFVDVKIDSNVRNGKDFYGFYRSHLDLGKTPDSSCSILYRADFLREFNLMFTSGVIFLEDGEFIARVMALANNCVVQWSPFYLARFHKTSSSNQKSIFGLPSIKGSFLAIDSLKKFSLEHFGAANDAFLQGLIIKYSLLPYQSAIGPRGIDWKKHRWVHQNMCDRGFYPIDTNSGNAYLVMLAKWLNRSVYYYYFRWWFRLLGISLRAKFIKR